MAGVGINGDNRCEGALETMKHGPSDRQCYLFNLQEFVERAGKG